MTRLLLVRHGSTAWSAASRYQGQTDITLSPAGRKQAKRLGERLRSERIDAVYSSNLRRAWETAEEIAAHHPAPIRAEPRLREISFGEWEGKTHQEIEESDSVLLAHWFDDPMHGSPPGGETLREVVSRVGAAYEEIVTRHSGQAVVIAAHGGTLRVLVCLALGFSPESYWRFQFDAASLSELDVHNEGAILECLNDTAHLCNGRAKT